MSKFSAEFYTKPNGEKPAKDFLLSQNSKMKAKLFGLIDILEEYGNELREPYSKHLEDGIFEIRRKTGTNITRILYFFYYEGRIVFTNGFAKKLKKHLEIKLNSQNVIVPIFLKGSDIMSEFKELLNEQLQDETFKKEWEDIQPELDVIRAMVNARISQNLTQKELAERTGINQADISKLENGTRNPSLKLLKRLAAGMGMALKIEFIPLPKKEI